MTYNPFETKRRNEMIARLEKERNTHREENKRLREELDSLRIEPDVLRNACDYTEKLIAKLQDTQPQWIKINSEADLPKEITECFVYDDDGDIGYYTFGILDDDDNEYIKENGVTHYAPMIKPQPPKEDQI